MCRTSASPGLRRSEPRNPSCRRRPEPGDGDGCELLHAGAQQEHELTAAVELLAALPDDRRVGVGVVNQKQARVPDPTEIEARIRGAVEVLGRERVLLNPDCGFATFADNPITATELAEAQLAAMVAARDRLH